MKLSICKWKCFYNLHLSLPAKWSQEQDGEHEWAVLILRAQTWPHRGVQASGLLGRTSIKKEMMGQTHDNLARLHRSSGRTSVFFQRSWWKWKGRSTVWASLLRLLSFWPWTSNLQNPRIRNNSKLLSSWFLCTVLWFHQYKPDLFRRDIFNFTAEHQQWRYGLKIECQQEWQQNWKCCNLPQAEKWNLSFNSTKNKWSLTFNISSNQQMRGWDYYMHVRPFNIWNWRCNKGLYRSVKMQNN